MSASGVPTNRTNFEIDPEQAAFIIQKAQEQSAIMSLAQRITLPGNGLTIPVIASDPEAAWVAETGVKPVKNPGFDKKVMQAYKMAVIVPFSDEFRRDRAALYNAIIARLPGVLAKKFDETVFHGSAPGSNFDTLAAVEAIDITSDPFAALVDADTKIALADGMLNGYAISPMMRGALLGATDTTHRPLFINGVADGAIPRLLGQPTYSSKGVYVAASGGDPAVVGFAGDWTKAMYGVVNGINISYSDQATLAAKNASNQDITINLWQQNMFAVRAEFEVGFIVSDASCFKAFTYVPTGATGATGGTGANG